MKSERGITLISLITYVIIITFVIAGISTITASFYTNINEFGAESEGAVSFARLNMHLVNDIKKEGIRIQEVSDDRIIISYTETVDGTTQNVTVQYTLQNDILYRNKVKICENIKSGLFTADTTNNTINIYLQIGDYQKTTTYALKSQS